MKLIEFLFYLDAFLFGAWPLVIKLSGLSPQWMAAAVGSSNCFIALIWLLGNISSGAPSTKPLLIGFAAGIMNSAGILLFLYLVGNVAAGEPQGMSQFITKMNTAVVLFSFAAASLIFQEPLTGAKIGGLILAVAAIYLLS